MSDLETQMVKAVLSMIRQANLPAAPANGTAAGATASAPVDGETPPPVLNDRLALGQQYTATVVQPEQNGQAVLRILNQLVTASSSGMPLKQGQHITVEVTAKGDVIELKVIPPTSQQDIRAQFLKIDLPRQIPLKALVQTLNQLSGLIEKSIDTAQPQPAPSSPTGSEKAPAINNPAATTNAAAPAERPELQQRLLQLIRQIDSAIPRVSDLKDPQQFSKLLQQSGLFLEKSLASGQFSGTDLKASLLQVAAQLRVLAEQAALAETVASADARSRLASARSGAMPGTQQNPAGASPATATGNPQTSQPPSAQTAAQSAGQLPPQNANPVPRPADPLQTATAADLAGKPGAVPADKAGQPMELIRQALAGSVTGSSRPASVGQPPAGMPDRQANPNSPAATASGATPAAAPAGSTVQQVTSSAGEIQQVGSVTDKAGLSASQQAQRALMTARPASQNSAATAAGEAAGASLLSQASLLQAAINLLPKGELNILLQQLLFRKAMAGQANSSNPAASHKLSPLRQLLQAVESGLARLQTQQLASVPVDDTTRQVWQFEIPLREQREIHSLMMRIEQEDQNDATANSGSTWTVSLNIDMDEMGHIHSKVRLTGENVSTHFWAEQEKTVQKISGHLDKLSKNFELLGLTVQHMTAALGKPPDPVEIVSMESSLLDEQA